MSLGKGDKIQNLFETPIKKQLLRCCSFHKFSMITAFGRMSPYLLAKSRLALLLLYKSVQVSGWTCDCGTVPQNMAYHIWSNELYRGE